MYTSSTPEDKENGASSNYSQVGNVIREARRSTSVKVFDKFRRDSREGSREGTLRMTISRESARNAASLKVPGSPLLPPIVRQLLCFSTIFNIYIIV